MSTPWQSWLTVTAPRWTGALSNGTLIQIDRDHVLTTLPNGAEVHARPNDQSAAMAERLGYGADVEAMTREHDPLHSILCNMLDMPHSFSLMLAAGCDIDRELAGLEEEAVLAVQRFARAYEVRR